MARHWRIASPSDTLIVESGASGHRPPSKSTRPPRAPELPGVGLLVVRCFGVALVALGIAAWPRGTEAEPSRQALRAMVIYNVMIAGLLGYAEVVLKLGGPLLWPAVAIHTVVAVLLIRPRSLPPSTL